MIGRPGSTRQRLAVAAALVVVLSLAGPSMSHAAPSNASGTGYVNGLPCNDICKAYMAWSDRVMARLRPAPQSPPKARIAVRQRKPERTVYRESETRHADLSSFAQLLRRSNAPARTAEPPQAAEPPQVAVVEPSGHVDAVAERLSPAAGIANARSADAGSATSEPPPRELVSLTAPISDTQDTSTTDDFGRSRDRWLTASLGLALVALFLLFYWARSRPRTPTANSMR
jgi:hypothetical protein